MCAMSLLESREQRYIKAMTIIMVVVTDGSDNHDDDGVMAI